MTTHTKEMTHAPLKRWREHWKQSRKGLKDTLLKRLADWINDQVYDGEASYKIDGPLGICARHWITIFVNDEKLLIPVEVEISEPDWVIGLRRFDLESSGEYPPNSIGDINGMNYPLEKAPLNPTADWFQRRLTVIDTKTS